MVATPSCPVTLLLQKWGRTNLFPNVTLTQQILNVQTQALYFLVGRHQSTGRPYFYRLAGRFILVFTIFESGADFTNPFSLQVGCCRPFVYYT